MQKGKLSTVQLILILCVIAPGFLYITNGAPDNWKVAVFRFSIAVIGIGGLILMKLLTYIK